MMKLLDKVIAIINVIIFIGLIVLVLALPMLIMLTTNISGWILVLIIILLIIWGTVNSIRYLAKRSKNFKEISFFDKVLILVPITNFLIISVLIILIIISL